MPYTLSVEDFAEPFSDANIARYDENILNAHHIPRPPRSRYVIPPKYLQVRLKKADDKSQTTLIYDVFALEFMSRVNNYFPPLAHGLLEFSFYFRFQILP